MTTTDLGLLELSEGVASRFDLGGGTNCVVTPTALSDGNARIEITLVVTNAEGTASQTGQVAAHLAARPAVLHFSR
jgi:hypothetical protein